MEIIAIFILGFIIGIVLEVYGTDNRNNTLVEAGCIITFLSLILPIIYAIVISYKSPKELNQKEPNTIEVYKSKTTLQITYQDSVPVDTIVIYKENIK